MTVDMTWRSAYRHRQDVHEIQSAVTLSCCDDPENTDIYSIFGVLPQSRAGSVQIAQPLIPIRITPNRAPFGHGDTLQP
jgi:hypothetical protein